MAEQARLRPPVSVAARLCHRILGGSISLGAPLHHPSDQTADHLGLQHHGHQLALPGLSDHRRLADLPLHQICRERQYLPRHHARALCHRDEEEPPQAPQYLVVGRGLGHHYRLWWIRGSRGPDRPDGIGHWLQPRPALPFGAQAADAPRGLWRLGSRGRHFQGPDSGTGLHDRDPDGRSDHGLAPAHPHLLGHGHLLLLPLHGRGLDVQFPYRRHLPARPSASHHPPGCGLWLRLHLLHAHDVVV